MANGLKFGGHRYRIAPYWESNPGSVCPRCCRIGHTGYRACGNRPPKCAICAGDHEAIEHHCTVLNCASPPARPCQHTVIRCASCDGKHEATSPKCPKIREARQRAQRRVRERSIQDLIPTSPGFAVVPPRVILPLREESIGEEMDYDLLSAPEVLPSSPPLPPIAQRLSPEALNSEQCY
jgi:hypothetical protein